MDVEKVQHWDSRGHFFAAAAEAMRRILVEAARQKSRLKRGGHLRRVDLDKADPAADGSPHEVLAVDDALSKLTEEDPHAAELIKLRYFAGFSIEEAAEMIGMSRTTAYDQWEYAKAWLRCELGNDESSLS